MCRCKNYDNQNEKRPTEADTPAFKRRRLQYPNQTMPLQGSTDTTFMQKAREKVNIGKFTTFEFLLTVLHKKLEGTTHQTDKTINKY